MTEDGKPISSEASVTKPVFFATPFRYVRFRDPPYDDEALGEWADRLRAVDVPLYAYFRHEDEPTAPAYALRLLELLGQ